MRKALIIASVIVLIFTSVMWITAENKLDDMTSEKGKLQTDYIILKGTQTATKQSLKNTSKAYVESQQRIAELERLHTEQQNRVSELEKKLQTEKAKQTASRSSTRQRTTVAASASSGNSDFWRRLANCECASGHCGGPYVGYFQFSRDTAAKVGIDGSESYEEQRAAAQAWAQRIHPREGTSSGWPVCWWKAQGA